MSEPAFEKNKNQKNNTNDDEWDSIESSQEYIGCTRIKKEDAVYPFVTNWKPLNTKNIKR